MSESECGSVRVWECGSEGLGSVEVWEWGSNGVREQGSEGEREWVGSGREWKGEGEYEWEWNLKMNINENGRMNIWMAMKNGFE